MHFQAGVATIPHDISTEPKKGIIKHINKKRQNVHKQNRSAQLTENFCTPCTSVLRGGRNPPPKKILVT